MLANERDELVGGDEECDCIDKPEQSQNDESRQPIGISQREKSFDSIPELRQAHGKTSNAEHPTSNLELHPNRVSCSRALTLSGMRFSFPAFPQGLPSDRAVSKPLRVGQPTKFARFCGPNKSQGSSVVEQGTHKPLVGSSTLPPGMLSARLGFTSSWLNRSPVHCLIR